MTYYSARLSGDRLRAVYELAPPRVRRYLNAEIEHLRARIHRGDRVLELGCGFGRILWPLAGNAGPIVGIDSAIENLRLGVRLREGAHDDVPSPSAAARPDRSPDARAAIRFALMDAARLGFRDGVFDLVACLQNGICAFRVDPLRLAREALRVTRPGGQVVFSTYAEGFWPHRVEWFERQAEAGLVGELDREATRDGVIACRDGFRSGTMRRAEFEALGRQLGVAGTLTEVDGSSLFWELRRPE